jgi:hypothetical protein
MYVAAAGHETCEFAALKKEVEEFRQEYEERE